jgi:DNA-binding SARP family transcriptional activator
VARAQADERTGIGLARPVADRAPLDAAERPRDGPGPHEPPFNGGFAGAEVRLSILDGFDVEAASGSLHLTRACQRLLALLALHDRPLLRTFVAGTLWMDSSEEHASGCLRSTLWRVHRARAGIVLSSVSHVWLDPAVRLDVREATTVAHRLLDRSTPYDPAYGVHVLLAVDLLPDWYDEWVVLERERFRQLRLHALEALCERLVAAGRRGEAVQAGLAAVAGEPLRESAHRTLIRAHLADGNRAEALRQYRWYADLLASELGLEPDPELTRLVHAAN